MSQRNVEIIRSILEPMNGVDVAAIDWNVDQVRGIVGKAFSPDVELHTLESGSGAGLDPVYHGWDGFVHYLRAWLEPFSEYRGDYLDFIDAGDWVVVPTRAWGTGKGSGARVEIDVVWAYELRDGVIVWMGQYDTTEQALEAVGQTTRP